MELSADEYLLRGNCYYNLYEGSLPRLVNIDEPGKASLMYGFEPSTPQWYGGD
tara:strand:+ start:163 stop:321 length:159 start_codon:yes stop_codon:yes gene_type:complete